jgi:hypothetical protein
MLIAFLVVSLMATTGCHPGETYITIPTRESSTTTGKEAPDELPPGRYTLKIGFKIEGKIYGTVPCTIDVIES